MEIGILITSIILTAILFLFIGILVGTFIDDEPINIDKK